NPELPLGGNGSQEVSAGKTRRRDSEKAGVTWSMRRRRRLWESPKRCSCQHPPERQPPWRERHFLAGSKAKFAFATELDRPCLQTLGSKSPQEVDDEYQSGSAPTLGSQQVSRCFADGALGQSIC